MFLVSVSFSTRLQLNGWCWLCMIVWLSTWCYCYSCCCCFYSQFYSCSCFKLCVCSFDFVLIIIVHTFICILHDIFWWCVCVCLYAFIFSLSMYLWRIKANEVSWISSRDRHKHWKLEYHTQEYWIFVEQVEQKRPKNKQFAK